MNRRLPFFTAFLLGSTLLAGAFTSTTACDQSPPLPNKGSTDLMLIKLTPHTP